MTTRKEKRPRDYGSPKWSSNEYVVYLDYPSVLFISKDADVPTMLRRDTSKSPDFQGRKAYVYKHRFTSEDNDCLQFAESLATKIVHYRAEECVYRAKGSRREFGNTDWQNIEVAKKYKENDKAAPQTGQSYAIVRTDLKDALKSSDDDIPPFHIAHVIAEDGIFRITLEADAGTRLQKPVFGIYSTNPRDSKTFHKMYKSVYGGQYAATIVLDPKEKI